MIAKAFCLPDGSYIKVETFGGDVNAHESDSRNWKAMDVNLIRPDGRDVLLCSVEYENQKGLRTLVYDDESDEPIYEHMAAFNPEVEQ